MLVIFHMLMLVFALPGCKEGTQNSPVSALLIDDAKQATINLQDLGEDVAKHKLVGTVISQNTSEKIANVNVSLTYEGKLAGTTRTTSDGQFFFTKLPPGLFEMVFSTADKTYKDSTYIARILEDGTVSPATIEVKLSATNPEQIKVQAKIEGEVILSGAGTKLANLNIELEDATGLLISTALSSAQGTFAFENLPSGSYTIKAGKASSYVETSQSVSIRADGVVSPKYSVLGLSTKPIENFSITGFVKTQNKESLTNLEVKIFEDPELTKQADEPTRTTGEGKFFFEGIKKPAIYYIKAFATTNTDASEVYPVRVLADGTTSPSVAEIFVTRNETILSYKATGVIYDAFTGGPLEYATVKIADLNIAVTDKNGQFYTNDLLAGTYKIEISKFGYETLSTSFVIKNSDKVLTLPLLHNMKTGYGSIAGRFVNEATGVGVADLTVRLYKWVYTTKSRYETLLTNGLLTDVLITKSRYEYNNSLILTTKTSNPDPKNQTDLPGSFKLTHLEPGYYLVYITSDPSSGIPATGSESWEGFSWLVPNKAADPGFKAEIRSLLVEAGKTTFWTNYEQEFK